MYIEYKTNFNVILIILPSLLISKLAILSSLALPKDISKEEVKMSPVCVFLTLDLKAWTLLGMGEISSLSPVLPCHPIT